MPQKQFLFIFTFITALFTATFALADNSIQKITVMGVTFEATKISYFVGSNDIHSFTVTSPVTFNFARGNTFTASDTVYLHKNGNISTVVSTNTQELNWITPSGQIAKFDCSAKLAPNLDKIARAVSFHENKEYKGGCTSYGGIDFVDDKTNLRAFGNIDVTPDFKLIYAQKADGSVRIGNEMIHLYPGREIAKHNSGEVRFCTPDIGVQFSVDHPTYGKLLFTQKNDKPTSAQFFDNGMIERGILAQDIIHNELKLPISKGSGVLFSREENYLIYGMIFSAPIDIKAQEYVISTSSLIWDTKRKFYNATVAASFTFKMPETGALLNVPVGSIVGLDYNWKIIGIMVPRKPNEDLGLAPTHF